MTDPDKIMTDIRVRLSDNHPGDVMFGHYEMSRVLAEVDRLAAENEALRAAWEDHNLNGCAGTQRLEAENAALRAAIERVEVLAKRIGPST